MKSKKPKTHSKRVSHSETAYFEFWSFVLAIAILILVGLAMGPERGSASEGGKVEVLTSTRQAVERDLRKWKKSYQRYLSGSDLFLAGEVDRSIARDKNFHRPSKNTPHLK